MNMTTTATLLGKDESNPLTDTLRRLKHGILFFKAKCNELTSCL